MPLLQKSENVTLMVNLISQNCCIKRHFNFFVKIFCVGKGQRNPRRWERKILHYAQYAHVFLVSIGIDYADQLGCIELTGAIVEHTP